MDSGRRLRRVNIEIPIHVQPRRYVPGSGPPPPRIFLLPKHDTDAYIVAKIVLPLAAVPDPNQRRRLCYVVGWPDLPQAKITIPCTKILEYVSPRTVEDWEYHNALKKEEEERKVLEQSRKAEHAVLPVPPKKRRGRPPKAALMDAPLPEPTLNEADKQLLAKRKAAGPSLATPQKRRRDLDSEIEDSETAIARQLELNEMDIESSEVDFLRMSPDLGSGVSFDEPSRASSVKPLDSASGTSGPLRDTTRPASLPLPLKTVQAGRLRSTSQIPLPPVPLLKSTVAANKDRSKSPSKMAAFVPRVHATGQGLNGTVLSSAPSNGFTPVASSHGRRPPHPSVSDSGNLLPSSSAITISRSKQSSVESPQKRGKKKKEPAEPPVAPAEQAWEVKRLEGDKYVEIDGQVTHYFKVRWEGDWPPDQNPTWEPEENITKGLIKQYLKKKAAKGSINTPTVQKSSQMSISPWATKKYTSVADAFAGEDEVQDSSAVIDSDGEGDGDETLLVTDENPAISRAKAGHRPSFSNFDQQLARHYALFSRQESS